MPRAVAALTMEPVLGPRRTSSSSSRRRLRASGRSKGVSSSAARTSCWASSIARRPTSSSLYSTTTWNTPGSIVVEVRPNVTGQPAWACMVSETICSTWAMETAPWWPSGAAGRSAAGGAQPRLEVGEVVDGALGVGAGHDGLDRRVLAPQIGPRSARMRETSMAGIPVVAPAIRARRVVSVLLDPAADQIDGGAGEASSDCSRTKSPVAMASSAPAMALPWSGSSSMCLTRLPCARPLAQQRARLAFGTLAAHRGVVVQHHAVEGVAQQLALFDQVGVGRSAPAE